MVGERRMSRIVYWQEVKITFIGLLKKVFYRIFFTPFSPFTVFEDIARFPETVGPVVTVIILVALQIFYRKIIENNVIIKFYNITKGLNTPSVIYEKNYIKIFFVNNTINNYMTLTYSQYFTENYQVITGYLFFIYTLFWILLALLCYLIVKLLKGRTEAVFVSTGYIMTSMIYYNLLEVLLVYLVKDYNILVHIYSMSPKLIDLVFSSILPLVLKARGLEIIYKVATAFISLWNLVMLVAVFNSAAQVEIKKSIIGAILSFIAFSFLYTSILNTFSPLILLST